MTAVKLLSLVVVISGLALPALAASAAKPGKRETGREHVRERVGIPDPTPRVLNRRDLSRPGGLDPSYNPPSS